MTADEYGPVVSHTDGQWDVQPAPTPRTPQQIAAIWGRTATEVPDDGELARAAAWLQAAWERESTADRAAYLEQLSASARTHTARRFFHDLARKVREHGDLPKTTAQLAKALLAPNDDKELPMDPTVAGPTGDAAQTAVDIWNATVPVGTEVRYWRGFRPGPAIRSRTRTPAEVLSGHTAVVWVEGESSCIALSHVTKQLEDAEPRDVSQIEHEIAEVARDSACCPRHRLLCDWSDFSGDRCCDNCPDWRTR